jgi:hypothetical protein
MIEFSDDARNAIEDQFKACEHAGKSVWSALHQFEFEGSLLIFDIIASADGYIARLIKPGVFDYQTEMEKTFELSVAKSAGKFLDNGNTIINKIVTKLKSESARNSADAGGRTAGRDKNLSRQHLDEIDCR